MRLLGMIAAATLVVAAGCAPAIAAYPDKPVSMIVPFPAGSAVDVAARYFARVLEEKLGQPFIVDNKLGAGGALGAEAVARARPNGLTILLTTASSMTTAAALYKTLPYDPAKDFAPIFGINTTGIALTINAALPVNSAKEMVAYVKANPGKLSFGSAGIGTSTHLAGEMFMQQTGTKMVHIPYKGGPPAAVDLLAGNVQLMFAPTPTAQSSAETGKAKVLAVLGPERTADLPGIPTMAEVGLPELAQSPGWFAFFFPKGTPSEFVDIVEKAMKEKLSTEEGKKQLPTLGLTTTIFGHQELATRIVEEIKTYKELVTKANIPLQ